MDDHTDYRRLDADGVREIVGDPAELVVLKVADRIDANCRRFIERAPFVALGTVNAEGQADVSPRGDPPGFVKVLDEGLLAIPERPGNKLKDSLTNIVDTGSVGLLFVIPGIEETLRVNGRGSITDDPELLGSMAVEGKTPKVAILVEVEEAYVHCAKAFKRSKLWDPASKADRSEVPSLGRIIRDQIPTVGMTATEIDEYAEGEYRTGMY